MARFGCADDPTVVLHLNMISPSSLQDDRTGSNLLENCNCLTVAEALQKCSIDGENLITCKEKKRSHDDVRAT